MRRVTPSASSPRRRARRRARRSRLCAVAVAAAEGFKRQAVPRHRRRQAVFLAGRHGVGALPSPEPRGRGEVPEEPRRAALHRRAGGGAGRARRAQRPECLRRATARGQRSGQAQRGVLRARGLDRQARQRTRHLRRHASHVGRQVEQEVGRRAGDLHGRQRRGVRRMAGATLQGRRHHLDPRRRPPCRKRRAQRDHPRHGAWPAQGRRRRAPAHVSSPRRQRLGHLVPRRRLARLQHAAERPRARVHRPLRQDARRLRPHAGQAGDRRRADLRRSPGVVQRQEARPLDRRRRAPAAVLGSVQRRLRPHLRASLGVADVVAGAGRRSTTR